MAMAANFPHCPDLPGLCSVRHGLRLMSINSRLLDRLSCLWLSTVGGDVWRKSEERDAYVPSIPSCDRLENMPSLTLFGKLDVFFRRFAGVDEDPWSRQEQQAERERNSPAKWRPI